MAARRSSRCNRASPTAIITQSGSIRRTAITSGSETTAVSTSRTIKARPGSSSTRFRRRSSMRSQLTCANRITCMVVCRTTVRGVVRARHALQAGITNADWFRTGGGDGFYAQADPNDPNIIYSESQNGAMNRIDMRTGRSVSIRPRARYARRRRRWRRWWWRWSCCCAKSISGQLRLRPRLRRITKAQLAAFAAAPGIWRWLRWREIFNRTLFRRRRQ